METHIPNSYQRSFDSELRFIRMNEVIKRPGYPKVRFMIA